MRPPSIDARFEQYRRSGDPQCLADVFDVAAPRLLSLALHLAGEPADAEDLVQATFVTAMERAASFQSGAAVLPWLNGILTRHAATEARRSRRRPRPERMRPVEASGPEELAQRAELVSLLRRGVERLPDGCRQVVLLRMQHGLQPAEIGEVLGIPAGTVRMRLHRGLAKLRALLPAGVLVALCGISTRAAVRGLARVRADVLAKAPLAWKAAPLLSIGGLLSMKKLWVGIVALTAALVWYAGQGQVGVVSEPSAADAPPATALQGGHASTESGGPEPADAERRIGVAAAAPLATGRGALRVEVRTESGDPARWVAVSVASRDGSDPTLGPAAIAVDDAGIALFDDLPAGLFDVWLDRERRGAGPAVDIPAGGETRVALVLRPGTRARGIVVDDRGVAVPFADLWLLRQVVGFPCSRIGRADASGRFAVEGLQIGSRIGASAAGHAPSLMYRAHAPGSAEVELSIALRGLAAGLVGVVYGPDRRPMADAVVTTAGALSRQFAGGLMGWPPRVVRTGTDGGFALPDLHPGTEFLDVRAAGAAPLSRRVELVAGQRTAVEISLERGALLTGSVRDRDGRPIEADVRVTGFADHHTVSTRCGADGSFSLACLPAQRIEVTARATGWQTARRVFYPDAAGLRWDATLEREAIVRLRLVDDAEQPLGGWKVRWIGRGGDRAQTDDQGRATLPLAPGARGRLAVRAAAIHGEWRCDWLGDLRPSDDEIVVRIGAARTAAGALRGTLDATEEQFGAMTIAVHQLGVNRVPAWIGRFAVEEGSFEVGPLAAGRYALSLFAARPAHRWVADLGEFEIGIGQRVDAGRVSLPAAGQLDLQVRRNDGEALRGTTVHFVRPGGREIPSPATPTPDGKVTRALPAGDYRIAVLSNNAEWVSQRVRIDAARSTVVTLDLAPATRRLIRFPAVEPPGWEGVQRVEFWLRDAGGRTLHSSVYDPREEHPYRYAPALPAGAYRLELELDDGRRFRGEFAISDLSASRSPIVVDVEQLP